MKTLFWLVPWLTLSLSCSKPVALGGVCPSDGQCGAGTRCCAGICRDVSGDVLNCGACGTVCSTANAASRCLAAVCTVSCTAGFADCNANADDGCEAALSSAEHCGACSNVCSSPNAAVSCSGSACAMGSCLPGFGDCDHAIPNGCETDVRSSVANCGSCGNACAPAHGHGACGQGSCRVSSCEAGFGDCNLQVADGCEVDFRSSNQNCGACGTACGAGLSCLEGSCVAAQLLLFGGADFVTGSTSQIAPVAALTRFDLQSHTFTPISASPSGVPEPRFAHVAAFDAAENRMIVWGGSPARTNESTWSLDLTLTPPLWTELTLTGGQPPSRAGPAIGFDPVERKLYVFGGGEDSGTELGDFWVLDLVAHSWTQLHDATQVGAPPGRAGCTGAWDPQLHRFLVFGGYNKTTNTYFNDLWSYDPQAPSPGWTELKLPGVPPPRGYQAGSFGAGSMFVYGGAKDVTTVPTVLGDFYRLAVGSTPAWLVITGSPNPGTRTFAAMASVGSTPVLFGGGRIDPSTFSLSTLDDVWRFDNGAWVPLTQPGEGSSHPGRVAASMVVLH